MVDALGQAVHDRALDGPLVHHRDHGTPSLAFRYTERLCEPGGLYKAEVIHQLGPWKGLEDVEQATLEWVAW